MSGHTDSEVLTSRVLDYAGMGFLLVPPEVLVLEVAMNKEPVNWILVGASFLGCYVVGIILLSVGLKWGKVKPRLSENLLNSIRRVTHSGVTWAFMLVIVAFGPVALVYLFSTPPSNYAPEKTTVTSASKSKWLNIDDATKWQFSSTLRSTTIASDGRLTCPFTVNLSFQENGGGSICPVRMGILEGASAYA